MTDEQELLAKFLEFADSDYVPNTLFDRARALLASEDAANGAMGLTDEQLLELRRIARTYNEQGFPKHAREFFARAAPSVETKNPQLKDSFERFDWLCSLLPEGTNWGDALDPNVLDEILLATASPAAPAQSGEPVAKIVAADEYGPRIEWSTHWVELIGASLYAAPQPSQPAQSGALNAHERNALNEAVKQLPSISALRTLRDRLLVAPQPAQTGDYIDVVFDGPPSHESGRFVECEDPDGKSVNAGEWIDRGNGLWALRIKK